MNEEDEVISASSARNIGLKNAKGDYLLFFDADDFASEKMIASLVQKALEDQAEIVVCRSYYYDNTTDEHFENTNSVKNIDFSRCVAGVDLASTLFQSFIGWAWDKLFKKDFLKINEIEFQELETSDDALFVFVNLCLANRISFVEKPLPYHRINNNHSLENSRDHSWHCALEAVKAIQNELISRNLYPIFKDSFLDWSLDFSLWNVETLTSAQTDYSNTLMEEENAYIFKDLSSNNELYSDKAAFIRSLKSQNVYFGNGDGGALLLAIKYFYDLKNAQELVNSQVSALHDANISIDTLTKNLNETLDNLKACQDQLNRVYNSKTWKLHTFLNEKIFFWRKF